MSELPSHYNSSGAQFAWDATSLEAYCKCPRYYAYMILESWEAPTKSFHLVFGGHYARALETYHKLTIREGVPHDEAVHSVVRQTLIESWVHNLDAEGNRIPGTGHVQIELTFDNAKNRENLIRSIVWYLEEYRDSDYLTYVTSDGQPAVEYSFKLELGPDLLWCGHIDRLIYQSDTPNTIYVQDQKTTGAPLGSRYFKQFDTSLQMSGYTFAGNAIYSIPIKGVMIDAAQIAVGFTRFMRGFTFRQADQLEEWFDEVKHYTAEAQRRTVAYRNNDLDVEAFPRNLASCGNYGGCAFADVCTTPRSLRKQMLKGGFSKRRPWNPLEER